MGPKKDAKKEAAEPPPEEQPPPIPPHELQGYGRFEYVDGSTYEGKWRLFDGIKKKHGEGILKIPGASKDNMGAESYEGSWVEDKMCGYGVYKYANGAFYKGEWKDNKHHGRGEYQFPNGTNYEGDWECHLMHGAGRFIDSQGRSWEGEFRKGRYESKLQKELAKERELMVKKSQYIKDIEALIGTMLEAIAKSDKKTLKENFSPFFPSGDVIKEQVKDPYSKFDEKPPEKWTEVLTLLKTGKINPLASVQEAQFIAADRVLKPQLEGPGQVVEVICEKDEKAVKGAFVNVEGNVWVLFSFSEEDKK